MQCISHHQGITFSCRYYQTNNISFYKSVFNYLQIQFFSNISNTRVTKSNNLKYFKVQKIQIQIGGELQKLQLILQIFANILFQVAFVEANFSI